MVSPSRPPVEPEPVAGPSFCYRHPMRETSVRCIRCNRPICPDCMRTASVGFQCPDDVRAGRIVTRTEVGAPTPSRQPGRGWRSIPIVTGAMISANVIVYIITAFQSVHGVMSNRASSLFESWVLVPTYAANGTGQGQQLYRLLTSTFLHNGIVHVTLNMLALLAFGIPLERLLGWWRFGAVYLIGALGGSLTVFVLDNPYVAVAGASGAIYGLLAAALIFVRQLKADLRSLVMIIGLNAVISLSVPGISWLAHLGGFVFGGLAAGCIWLPRKLTGSQRVLTQSSGLLGLLVLIIIGVLFRSAAI